jgi:hypothetical protein
MEPEAWAQAALQHQEELAARTEEESQAAQPAKYKYEGICIGGPLWEQRRGANEQQFVVYETPGHIPVLVSDTRPATGVGIIAHLYTWDEESRSWTLAPP